MTRPLRLEFPGALYHVTSRGDNRRSIYHDHEDRQNWLEVLAHVCSRLNFSIHAYCEMGNHYHLMVETEEGNLSQGMHQLNSIYTQQFNRRHHRVGHVLQGRYKAILVQKESYLLELARYVVLNPVRAGIVDHPGKWQWSSYNYTSGAHPAPAWLKTEWLLGQFGSAEALACDRYRQFVLAGVGKESPLKEVQHQMVLGDEAFVAGHGDRLGALEFTAVVKAQRRIAAMTLPQYAAAYARRDEAMAAAYRSTAFSMVQIGAHFGVSDKTVSRAVRKFETKD